MIAWSVVDETNFEIKQSKPFSKIWYDYKHAMAQGLDTRLLFQSLEETLFVSMVEMNLVAGLTSEFLKMEFYVIWRLTSVH